MLNNLVFSAPKKRLLTRRQWFISAGIHLSVLILIGLVAGRTVMPLLSKPQEQHIVYTSTPVPDPKPVPPPERVHVAPPKPVVQQKAAAPRLQIQAPRPVQPKVAARVSIPVPVAVATTIPAPDLSKTAVVSDGDVKIGTPPPVTGGDAKGSSKETSDNGSGGGGGLNSGASDKAFTEDQVEKEVQLASAKPNPHFPDALRAANVQGIVIIRFIVGTDGRVEKGSFEVVSTPHQEFADAVKRALLDTRYRPAEVGGRPVRQMVEQSFAFKLN